MTHEQAINILMEKADKNIYDLPNGRVDSRRILDEYYSLIQPTNVSM